MKKKLLFIVFCLTCAFAVVYASTGSTNVIKPTNNPDREVLGVTEPLFTDLSLEGKNFRVYKTPFFAGEEITLIPNFSKRLVASEIKSQNKCSYLINAGFYTEQVRPVGYFKSDETPLKTDRESVLFDAFFTINFLRTPRLTRALPSDQILYGIQLGPFLVENTEVIPLSIRNDKPARRVVLAINGENKVIFLLFVSPDSDYTGPFLSQLPNLVSLWSEKTGIKLADSVNLDGGSASAFLTPDASFSEISPIGSAFCMKSI